MKRRSFLVMAPFAPLIPVVASNPAPVRQFTVNDFRPSCDMSGIQLLLDENDARIKAVVLEALRKPI